MSNVPRVLIVQNELLLGAGLQALLAHETDLEVIGISPHDQAELAQDIRQIRPDIVFLDEDSYLVDAGELLILLQDLPKLRVMVINTNDNLLHIYDVQQVMILSTTQLINLIMSYAVDNALRLSVSLEYRGHRPPTSKPHKS